jgi:hypothetical protein
VVGGLLLGRLTSYAVKAIGDPWASEIIDLR